MSERFARFGEPGRTTLIVSHRLMTMRAADIDNLSDSLPTVLLQHELPDGSWHVDWLIARDPAGQQPLISFRLASRPDELRAGESVATERLADHRPQYLGYEGPISGDRGHVTRVAGGQVRDLVQDARRWSMTVVWNDRSRSGVVQRLVLTQQDQKVWQLTAAPI